MTLAAIKEKVQGIEDRCDDRHRSTYIPRISELERGMSLLFGSQELGQKGALNRMDEKIDAVISTQSEIKKAQRNLETKMAIAFGAVMALITVLEILLK